MSTVVALHWNPTALHYVVARNGRIDTYATVDLEAGSSPTVIGKKLAEELSQQVSGRVQTVVALSRSSLQWQHLTLPPCPADELPDLVRMQSDREIGLSDEQDVGFDYLPLSGDEHTSYQVLTVAIGDTELQRIRQICREAHLTLDRIVPLASGWPSLTSQAGLSKASSQVFVAPLDSDATLWATHDDRVVLFRQFQYANSKDPAGKANAIGSELRRSLLSLSQNASFTNPSITLVGERLQPQSEIAQHLNTHLDQPVEAVGLIDSHTSLEDLQSSTPQLVPLAGIALDGSKSKIPMVDLLNPRRPPKPQLNYRTYLLAGVAASLLALMLGWTGYRNLKEPLEQAAEDRAAIALLDESREQLAEYEQDASAVRDWLAESPNLLVHLQQLSRTIRPETLQSPEFPLEQDVALQKLNLDKRQLVIEAIARDYRAVQPFENRLRKASYSPERGKSGPSKEEGYGWQFQSIVEIDGTSDDAARGLAQADTTEAEAEASEAPASEAKATEGEAPESDTSNDEPVAEAQSEEEAQS